MKTLLILLHAKSGQKDDPAIDDFDRTLNKRGKREAPRMGALLRDKELLPDLIVASAAKRTRKTAEIVAHDSGYRGETRLTGELYDARREKILEIVRSLPNTAARVLLVGHNPGLEELLELLTGGYRPLSTAALAQVELPIDSWQQADFHEANVLRNLWQPRELG